MSEELTEFKISQLNEKIEKIGHSVDKIFDRMEEIQKKLFEKLIYKKILSFLYIIYPAIMMAVMASSNVDKKKMLESYNGMQEIMSHVNEIHE